jgi:hypothetical protein
MNPLLRWYWGHRSRPGLSEGGERVGRRELLLFRPAQRAPCARPGPCIWICVWHTFVASVATLRLGGDTVAPRPETVRCALCGCRFGEDEAQAVRWALLSAAFLDVYPYCEPCATDEFGFSGMGLRVGHGVLPA